MSNIFAKVLISLLTSLVTEKFIGKMICELVIWASKKSSNTVDDRIAGHVIESLGFKKSDFNIQ